MAYLKQNNNLINIKQSSDLESFYLILKFLNSYKNLQKISVLYLWQNQNSCLNAFVYVLVLLVFHLSLCYDIKEGHAHNFSSNFKFHFKVSWLNCAIWNLYPNLTGKHRAYNCLLCKQSQAMFLQIMNCYNNNIWYLHLVNQSTCHVNNSRH